MRANGYDRRLSSIPYGPSAASTSRLAYQRWARKPCASSYGYTSVVGSGHSYSGLMRALLTRTTTPAAYTGRSASSGIEHPRAVYATLALTPARTGAVANSDAHANGYGRRLSSIPYGPSAASTSSSRANVGTAKPTASNYVPRSSVWPLL
jgi:hypothetical protein